MKPVTPHDPRNDTFDDLIAAALHGELTPEERAQFDSRLQNDPAAAAAYHEAQAMHDLLEQTNRTAQPDPDFEQRMVSAVRRKLAQPAHRETALESLIILWRGVTGMFAPVLRFLGGRSLWTYGGVCSLVLVCVVTVLFTAGNQVKSVFTTITSQLEMADNSKRPPVEDFVTTFAPPAVPAHSVFMTGQASLGRQMDADKSDERVQDLQKVIHQQGINYTETARKGITLGGYVDSSYTESFAGRGTAFGVPAAPPALVSNGQADAKLKQLDDLKAKDADMSPARNQAMSFASASQAKSEQMPIDQNAPDAPMNAAPAATPPPIIMEASREAVTDSASALQPNSPAVPTETTVSSAPSTSPSTDTGSVNLKWNESVSPKPVAAPTSPAATTPAPEDSRKLIRNAQLDLEVKSFQSAFDQITVMTRAAGGYVDTSNSQRGGNGKLQGTVVVKILPPNLDAFLLKLRDLGDVQNQSVSTDDVTKDYFDTQARLVNSQKMEEQLQDLLKRENGKVSDLLAVERELGRVRGDIEGMQGQLKLYDFQVQYATVTMNLAEKDLNQAAAYVLKEQDDFALFATDVEATYQKARQAADEFKTQVLVANLAHASGTDVSAELTVMVAPDQIENFLASVRGLGRVANFTRQTQRIAKDGGDANQPADQTLTEKDKVQVHLTIKSDDDSRKQVALTVVAKMVGDALDQAKAAALASTGVEILSSSLNATPQGASTAQLSVRVPGKEYTTLMDAFRALGRQASLSIQRNDSSGPGANGDDAPVIVSLSLTDEEVPVQTTDLVLVNKDVDVLSQQIKKDALASGVEIKSSSFEGQPNGTHLARMTLVLPLGKYPDYIETLKKAGRVQSLGVQRADASGNSIATDDAPVAIALALTDDDPPVQVTQLVIVADDVDTQSQQIKKQAAAAGVEIKDSNYGRDPDGSEHAQMTLRLPMGQYTAYVETLKRAGKVESFSVQREDRPNLPAADDSAPVEISLQLHNQRAIVADNAGLWPSLRQMFGEGFDALFGSVRVIGVLLAFLAPWVFTLVLFAWIGRRIYVWRKR